jgi:hypothetical protein
MIWLGYTWSTVWRLAYFVAVLVILASPHDKTHQLIVAVAGILFATIRSGFISAALHRGDISAILLRELAPIHQRLEIKDTATQDWDSFQKAFSQRRTILYIESFLQAAIYLASIYHLLSVI